MHHLFRRRRQRLQIEGKSLFAGPFGVLPVWQ
jgi:hypothetical protein